jgi:ABC-type transport system involved in cytochrome bd biosynthesis fused ATPase/permease subunit
MGSGMSKAGMKRRFQIVVSGPLRSDTEKTVPLSRVTRLKMLLQGFLVAAFVLGMLIAVLLIGSTIALVLWIAALITLVCVIGVVVFRRAMGKRTRQSDAAIDHKRGG